MMSACVFDRLGELAMSLIHKKILFYLLGAMGFLAVAGCETPPPLPTPRALPQMTQPTTPQLDCEVAVPELYGHYKGDCNGGKAHGRGEAIGKHRYQGEFVNGYPHGQGTYIWGDGERFVGRFVKGESQIPHNGCYVADRRLRGKYSGKCRGGKAYGRGKAVGIDTYDGEFIDGVLNGQGTYVWRNGDRYIGQFREGKRYGRGVMKYADGGEEEFK
ncbi:MAG: hypothetical protein DRR08_30395 [Candidatus Parabeggiatoa sp. nov. 2]|nr:MAG: hypothetical protein B6247_05340 [Beggiatoa sp. 4572_84]RKZ50337.1 MAG: hypothetical protein DRR08_30395 [Gammaproteobacteria bacterium]